MRLLVIAAACAAAIMTGASTAAAQDWTGLYVGGSIGVGVQSEDAGETVRFDTNLDGGFGDTIRTVAGADAFSTGFCGGLAVNATAAGGCTDDEDGLDVGGRAGYDWQFGRIVAGALATNPFILVNAAGTDLQRTGKFEFHAARAGLSYRF